LRTAAAAKTANTIASIDACCAAARAAIHVWLTISAATASHH
jgi:hypothetical protein